MQYKIILATLSAVFLTSSAVYGASCPTIPEKDWDGQTLESSGPSSVVWRVGSMKLKGDATLKDVKWKAYHAWILPENKQQYLKYGYFQCVYKAVDSSGKEVGKMTVASQSAPDPALKELADNSKFAGGPPDVKNDYTSGVKKGAKCAPSNAEANNKFPPECDIISRK
jgi:hypothetical protein